jgi:hypothetical protein
MAMTMTTKKMLQSGGTRAQCLGGRATETLLRSMRQGFVVG